VIRLDPARLVARGPDLAALYVAQEDVAAPIVARAVFAPARDPEVSPVTVPRANARQHDRVATVREQVRFRHCLVRGAKLSYRGNLQFAHRERRLDFLGPRMGHGD